MTFKERLEKIVEKTSRSLNPFTIKEVAIFSSAVMLAAALSIYGCYSKTKSLNYKNKAPQYDQFYSEVNEQTKEVNKQTEEITKLKKGIDDYKKLNKNRKKRTVIKRDYRTKNCQNNYQQNNDLFRNAKVISITSSELRRQTAGLPSVEQPTIPTTYELPTTPYTSQTSEKKLPETYTQPADVPTSEKKVPAPITQPIQQEQSYGIKIKNCPSGISSPCYSLKVDMKNYNDGIVHVPSLVQRQVIFLYPQNIKQEYFSDGLEATYNSENIRKYFIFSLTPDKKSIQLTPSKAIRNGTIKLRLPVTNNVSETSYKNLEIIIGDQ